MQQPNKLSIYLLFIFIIILWSCNQDYVPKPRSYFRIDLPQRQYQKFDSIFPYSFEYPVYSKIKVKTDSLNKPYWINIEFPHFKGSCYLSYLPVKNNLNKYLEDSRTLVMKHMPKSDGIEEVLVNRPADKVYGTVFHIKGSGAASSYQFYMTDSTQHFLRGALYFNVTPNNDSLQPVIDFISEDIDHLIKTLKWK